jgi:hypothetical protein
MISGEERINIMNQGKMKSLENLEPAKLEWLLDITAQSRLTDCVDVLKEQGIVVSRATLSRFVQKYRQKRLLESGEDMLETAEQLRKRGKNGALREGTLEALRQRLFEKALNDLTADEELREMYLDLVKEEAKLKELELAERRVAVGEEHARLARIRTRMELQNRPPKKVKLEEVEDASAGREVKQLAVASEVPQDNRKKELVDLILRVTEVIDGPGRAEEKVLDVRAVLAAGLKVVNEARSP